VGERLARESPTAIAALSELSGRIDVERMRRWNQRLEVAGEPVAAVAAAALRELGLTNSEVRSPAEGRPGGTSLLGYLWDRRSVLGAQTGRHLLLVVLSLLAAVLIAVPAGVLLERVPRAAEGVIRAVGVIQTLPGIALLAFMLPLLGIGVVPALVALFLYSLYPILRNTYTGVREADASATSAALSLGMTPGQVLRLVRLPLAAPLIMAGVRTAGVINVGTATLAAFIGAGGLGDPIVAGLALNDTSMVLSGALPAALLALLVDAALAWGTKRVRPGGV
jgi:osmoprotectant transport system permease protein